MMEFLVDNIVVNKVCWSSMGTICVSLLTELFCIPMKRNPSRVFYIKRRKFNSTFR